MIELSVTLPQAQVTENEKHDYDDANDVEDTMHGEFPPFSRNRRCGLFPYRASPLRLILTLGDPAGLRLCFLASALLTSLGSEDFAL